MPNVYGGREILMNRRYVLLGAAFALRAESLNVRALDGYVRVSAPGLRFLTGKPLERLRNGVTVPFAFQLALAVESRTSVRSRAVERIALSYDIWEEKFSASQSGGEMVSHLSEQAAESWCVARLAAPTIGVARDQPLWVRLEVRAENPKEQVNPITQPALALTRLIEAFSRPESDEEPRFFREAGPFRLAELERRTGAGK